jgi:hypothetical protein
MKETRRFVYEARTQGFVANGYDLVLRIYLTIASHVDRYVQVNELEVEPDGSIPAIAWFDDLVGTGIAEPIPETRFRQLLAEAMDSGFEVMNRVGDKLEEFRKSEVVSSGDTCEPSTPRAINLPCDYYLVAKLKREIETGNFGAVKRWFRDPLSELSQVLIVQEPYDLAEVGALVAAPPQHQELLVGLGLYTNGIVIAGVDDLEAVSPAMRAYACLLDSIPDDAPCDSVDVPPACLVKLRK